MTTYGNRERLSLQETGLEVPPTPLTPSVDIGLVVSSISFVPQRYGNALQRRDDNGVVMS